MSWGQKVNLAAFDNLLDKKWHAEGAWGDGSKFKQEIIFEYDLENAILISRSKGFTNVEQSKYGNRNHGIRKVNADSTGIDFWEFDVFGGVTKGKVIIKEKDILYQYDYGGSKVTDYWEYVNDSIYNFTVGSYENGTWNQKYLTCQFTGQNIDRKSKLYLKVKETLVGNWISPAWDGQLIEMWSVDKDQNLVQTSKYIEGKKVLFRSQNKIEYIGGELILISVIENSDPKIFKAVEANGSRIVFENKEYKNPNRVEYVLYEKTFHRKISGAENGSPTSYTFKFEPFKE